MKILLLISLICFLVNCSESKRPSINIPMVELKSSDFGDNVNNMKIVEIERGTNTSTMRLTYDKLGTSVGGSMFIMRGFYEVAKARGFEYFANIKEWEGEGNEAFYICGLTNNRNADIAKEFGKEYVNTVAGDKDEFYISVKESKLIFK